MKSSGSGGYPTTDLVGGDTESIPIPIELRDEDTGPTVVSIDKLVCVVGPDMGATFPVGGEPQIIGRGDASIVLKATDISRRHARISTLAGVLMIEDIGSANGTFLNGDRLTERRQLAVGDRIQLGSTILVLTRHDELEERLKQLQKLDAMGALVKGLAHDFNNQLTVIQAGLSELEGSTAAASLADAITDIRTATESAASLVRRMFDIGRSKTVMSDLVAIDTLLAETTSMLKRTLPPTIDLICHAAPGATVRGSREALRNVVVNLVINARDAMPNGGRITIATSVQKLDRTTALAKHLLREGAYVQLAITDTGHGMDQATLSRIFEPFFTTKPAGKGNGLGLAMVFRTVRNHQGAIHVKSAPRRGTTFELLLPLV